MNDQTWGNKARERAKLALRAGLYKLDLDLSTDPYPKRVVRALQQARIEVVVDVGANVGQFAALLRKAGYKGRLVSVEPLSGAFAELTRRSAGDPHWEAVQAAVGVDDGKATINVSANSFSSSILRITHVHLATAPASAVVGTEDVSTISVHTLLGERGIDPSRTLLKIDTQGYEGPVLDSAGDALRKLAAVQLELSLVELYAGQELFDTLMERMRAAGLTLWSMQPGISDASGRMLQCDGLFLRA